MADLVLAVPGDPATPTGGYEYDRQIFNAIAASGRAIDWLRLPDGFPEPGKIELARTAELFAGLGAGTTIIIDALAFAVLPPEMIDPAKRWIALVHHPLALETGITAEQAARYRESEKLALALAARVIVTSPATGETLIEQYGVSRAVLTVAEPGLDLGVPSEGSDPPLILSVGTVSARKAQWQLVRALAPLKHLPWQVEIAGALDRDDQALALLHQAIEQTGLGDRIHLLGALTNEQLSERYVAADLFVSTALYEGYGMALARAAGHGLPIIAYRGGAVADTVPTALLLELEDITGLTETIGKLLRDPARRAALGASARCHADSLPSWVDAAAAILAAVG